MMIPPFIAHAETVIDHRSPDVALCREKFDAVVGKEADIASYTASHSEKWGTVLRVLYRPLLDGHVINSDYIYMCWNPKEGGSRFVVSPVDEEEDLRKNPGMAS